MRAWRVYPEAALAAVVLVVGLVVVALAFVDVLSAGIAAVVAIVIGVFAALGPGRRA
jgi:hypothetical protein